MYILMLKTCPKPNGNEVCMLRGHTLAFITYPLILILFMYVGILSYNN